MMHCASHFFRDFLNCRLLPLQAQVRRYHCVHFTDKIHMTYKASIVCLLQNHVVELTMGLCRRHKAEVSLNCSYSKCETLPCIPFSFLELFQIFCLQVLAQPSETPSWAESNDLLMITQLVDLNPRARLFPVPSASNVQDQYLKSWLGIYSTAAWFWQNYTEN